MSQRDAEDIQSAQELGDRLRAMRRGAGLTLSQVAEMTGVTVSFLSQLERGLASASIVTLRRLTRALGVPMGSLFEDTVASRTIESRVVVRRSERRRLTFRGRSGQEFQLLAPDLNRSMEPLYNVAPPGYSSSEEPMDHAGEEWLYVIRGEMRLQVGDSVFTLQEGDCAYYPSTIPHRWTNTGDCDLEAIWVVTPPTF